MTGRSGGALRSARVASQTAFLGLFLAGLVVAGMEAAPSSGVLNFFFHTDPLILFTSLLATRTVQAALLISLVPLVATLLLGRFFCGWVCPLGTIHHFFSWLANRFGGTASMTRSPRYQVKYLVLFLILALSVGGVQSGMILDPISLLVRSASVVFPPATGAFAPRAEPWELAPANAPAGGQAAPATARAQAEVIGAAFLGLILLNFYRRRFFCHYLCPLGALYGLVARFRRLDLAPGEACSACGTCARDCAHDRMEEGKSPGQDCVMCFNCVRDCPQETVQVGFGVARTSENVPIDIGRRQVLGSVGSGLLLSTLPGLTAEERRRERRFVRPPGSLAENEFLSRCLRCGECERTCPANFIQMAGLEAGIEAVWSPVGNARIGYCDYACNACAGVCPSGAIRPMTLDEKRRYRIGMAVVDRSRCLTYANGIDCTICVERCPVPGGAIRLKKTPAWDYEGRDVVVNRIYVDPDLCIGCGVCEYVCPRTDAPGIVLTADGEQREGAWSRP